MTESPIDDIIKLCHKWIDSHEYPNSADMIDFAGEVEQLALKVKQAINAKEDQCRSLKKVM